MPVIPHLGRDDAHGKKDRFHEPGASNNQFYQDADRSQGKGAPMSDAFVQSLLQKLQDQYQSQPGSWTDDEYHWLEWFLHSWLYGQWPKKSPGDIFNEGDAATKKTREQMERRAWEDAVRRGQRSAKEWPYKDKPPAYDPHLDPGSPQYDKRMDTKDPGYTPLRDPRNPTYDPKADDVGPPRPGQLGSGDRGRGFGDPNAPGGARSDGMDAGVPPGWGGITPPPMPQGAIPNPDTGQWGMGSKGGAAFGGDARIQAIAASLFQILHGANVPAGESSQLPRANPVPGIHANQDPEVWTHDSTGRYLGMGLGVRPEGEPLGLDPALGDPNDPMFHLDPALHPPAPPPHAAPAPGQAMRASLE